MTTVQLKSGHTATEVEDEIREKVEKFFKAHQGGIVRLSPDGWVLPKKYLEFADKIYTFKYKKDDVIVMTWPKCGTTWMQEIIWTMRNNPNLDNPKGDLPVNVRCPFIDFDMLLPPPPPEPVPMEDSPMEVLMNAFYTRCPEKDPKDGIFIQLSENLEEPRTMKIHLPFSLTNPELVWKAKVVVVVRNPKDVCVSYYHHSRLFKNHGFEGELDDFVDFFVKDQMYYSPYWTYMKEVMAKQNHPNVHLVYYEKLKANPEAEMHRLDKFLGTNLTKDQIGKIIEYTSFNSMKDRENLIHPKKEGEISKLYNEEVVKENGDFFRQGEAGGYKKTLTEDQEAKIDGWTKKNSGGLERELKYSS